MTTDTALIETAAGDALDLKLDTFTDRHGETAHLVELISGGVGIATLTPASARRLAAELVRLADTTEPLNHEAFAVVLDAMGITLAEVAEVAGVDLATATRADMPAMTDAAGGLLAGSLNLPDGTTVSVGPGEQQ